MLCPYYAAIALYYNNKLFKQSIFCSFIFVSFKLKSKTRCKLFRILCEMFSNSFEFKKILQICFVRLIKLIHY